MKSFFIGLVTIVVLGIIGYFTFRATTSFMSKLNPTASASASPIASSTPFVYPSPTATPKPTATPTSDIYIPTTKGGLPIKGTVKGTSTSTVKTSTTTTTTSHLTLTLVKTSICPISYMTEIKDIQGPLTFKYSLIDNTSFGITIWKADGNELFSNTNFSGRSGQITTISGVDYVKVRVESKTCASNNDNWLTLTAER